MDYFWSMLMGRPYGYPYAYGPGIRIKYQYSLSVVISSHLRRYGCYSHHHCCSCHQHELDEMRELHHGDEVEVEGKEAVNLNLKRRFKAPAPPQSKPPLLRPSTTELNQATPSSRSSPLSNPPMPCTMPSPGWGLGKRATAAAAHGGSQGRSRQISPSPV